MARPWQGTLAITLMIALVTSCGSKDGAAPAPVTTCGPSADLRLVYTGAAGEGGGDLYGVTRNGKVRQLTSDGGSFDPAFSPDGDRIVFSSIGAHGTANGDVGIFGLDLYVMDTNGSGRHRLLDGDEDGMPTWSPDGRRIAFVRHLDTDNARILLVDVDDPTSARPLVDPGPGAFDTDPAWSPDGKRIAFARSELPVNPAEPGRYRLMVVDADGSHARTLLERDEPFTSPSWNPAGTKIAFTFGSVGERTGSLEVLDIDSGARHTLSGPGRAPVWSMSGRLYAYARNPAVSDFSGRWRVAEFETAGRGLTKGRAISAIEPNGYLYGVVGIDAPRCDGPRSPALTSRADVPDTLTVTDPATSTKVAVMTRDEARTSGNVTRPEGMSTDAKLVSKAALDNALEWSHLTMGSGDLVWVVSVPRPGRDGTAFILDARTGDFLESGQNLTAGQWSTLTDLAP